MYDCDVLIVGAGPSGVTLALELARQKISFRVIDKAPERSDKSRALFVQPRTLELLNRHGNIQALASHSNTVHGATFFVNNKEVTKISLDGLATNTEFPLPLGVSQADTEHFLDRCLAAYGASVERPVTAKNISQDDDGVTTSLERQDGSQETVRSKYVVGCDGAHSVVRHASANITFEGAAYTQDFLLCDAHISGTSIPLDAFSIMFGYGVMMAIPMQDGLVRFVTAGHPLESDTEPTLEHFQKSLDLFGPPGHGTLSNPVWITRFRLHHRSATAFRDRRFFLAGDAAHIHSPAGGQGMNTGIQDAINLGWKLAAVLQARAADPEALLNSYNAERHRVGTRLLRTTDQAFGVAATSHWLFARLRNFVMSWVMPWLVTEARRKMVFSFLSEFGITYRRSPIVGAAKGFRGPIGGGDRLPDGKLREAASEAQVSVQGICNKTHHCLLLFSGTNAAEAAEPTRLLAAREQVAASMKDDVTGYLIIAGTGLPTDVPEGSLVDAECKVHEQYGFTGPGYVLVRPDQYIAHIGPLSKLDELLVFLKG